MLRTIEAVIEPDGQVRLLERISVSGARRALVTVLDEPAEFTAFLSEPALASDWNRPEEDAAWQHLQEATWFSSHSRFRISPNPSCYDSASGQCPDAVRS